MEEDYSWNNHMLGGRWAAKRVWLKNGGRQWGPDEVLVNTCGVKGCSNPHHHTIANALDELLKKKQDGRSPLTADDVVKIRQFYKDKYPADAIAEVYGVSRVTIRNVVTGKTWGWVSDKKENGDV